MAGGLSWRGALEQVARTSYRLYLDHPWLLKVNWTRPVFGPNTMAGFESILAAIHGLGLTHQELVMLIVAVDSFVTGLARSYKPFGPVLSEALADHLKKVLGPTGKKQASIAERVAFARENFKSIHAAI